MENKEKIKCTCGSYVLKSNFNRHLKSPKHNSIVVKKTFDPSDKNQCECGKFISKANWARHLKSAQHLNFFENKNKRDESKDDLKISKSPAKSVKEEKPLKYSLMAEIPAHMGRSEFFHLARKETEAEESEKEEFFDVGADDDEDNFIPSEEKKKDVVELCEEEDSEEKSEINDKYTEEYFQNIINKYKNMPKPLETTFLDYLPGKESAKEAEINQPARTSRDKEIFQPGRLLALFMKAEEIVRNLNF